MSKQTVTQTDSVTDLGNRLNSFDHRHCTCKSPSTMTSLRTFQTEIEQIHQREVAKQRSHGPAPVTDKEKASTKNPLSPPAKGKAKEDATTLQTENILRSNVPEAEGKILVRLRCFISCSSHQYMSRDSRPVRIYFSRTHQPITTRLAR